MYHEVNCYHPAYDFPMIPSRNTLGIASVQFFQTLQGTSMPVKVYILKEERNKIGLRFGKGSLLKFSIQLIALLANSLTWSVTCNWITNATDTNDSKWKQTWNFATHSSNKGTNTWIYVSKSLQVSSYDCITTELLSYRKDDKDTDCIVLMSTMKGS